MIFLDASVLRKAYRDSIALLSNSAAHRKNVDEADRHNKSY